MSGDIPEPQRDPAANIYAWSFVATDMPEPMPFKVWLSPNGGAWRQVRYRSEAQVTFLPWPKGDYLVTVNRFDWAAWARRTGARPVEGTS